MNGKETVFACTTTAITDYFQQSIEEAMHLYCVENRPFHFNGKTLTPWSVTSDGGALLCLFINKQGENAVLLASICDEICSNEKYHKHFLAHQIKTDLKNSKNNISIEKLRSTWDSQKRSILRITWEYTSCTIVPLLLKGKHCVLLLSNSFSVASLTSSLTHCLLLPHSSCRQEQP